MNSYNYEAAKAIIEDTENINVTKDNPLKELIEILIKLVIILTIIYFSIFAISGIIIKCLPIKRQIELENTLSYSCETLHIDPTLDITPALAIRDKILKADKKYPPTSNLNISIIDDKTMNAACLPNGSIYITSGLYKQLLKDEKMLAFVIAHEMGHYKYKDHLMSLRKSISSAFVILSMSIVSPSTDTTNIDVANDIIYLSDLGYSRKVEERADTYAAKILYKLYGNIDGGIKLLKLLGEDGSSDIEILSTHPNFEHRISSISKLKLH